MYRVQSTVQGLELLGSLGKSSQSVAIARVHLRTELPYGQALLGEPPQVTNR